MYEAPSAILFSGGGGMALFLNFLKKSITTHIFLLPWYLPAKKRMLPCFLNLCLHVDLTTLHLLFFCIIVTFCHMGLLILKVIENQFRLKKTTTTKHTGNSVIVSIKFPAIELWCTIWECWLTFYYCVIDPGSVSNCSWLQMSYIKICLFAFWL